MSYEHGRILAVNEVSYGDSLVGDTPAGSMSLTVDDPADFDEEGGYLVINDQVIQYETYDDDTGEITLSEALSADALEGDRVDVWDPLYQLPSTEKIAEVEVDGEDDNIDPLEAVIPHFLVDRVSEGLRGLTGESVLLEEDGEEWRIVDILGLADPTATGTQFYQEKPPFTASADGDQSLTLTYQPLADSEHIIVNGLTLTQADYTLSGTALTVPARLTGDVIDVKYAYQRGVITKPAAPYDLDACTTATFTDCTASIEVFNSTNWMIHGLFHGTWKDSGVAQMYWVGVYSLPGDAAGTYHLSPTQTIYSDEFGQELSGGWYGQDLTQATLVGVQVYPGGAGGGVTSSTPQNGGGSNGIGVTDPTRCRFYFGQKIAVTDGITDQPMGGIDGSRPPWA